MLLVVIYVLTQDNVKAILIMSCNQDNIFFRERADMYTSGLPKPVCSVECCHSYQKHHLCVCVLSSCRCVLMIQMTSSKRVLKRVSKFNEIQRFSSGN